MKQRTLLVLTMFLGVISSAVGSSEISIDNEKKDKAVLEFIDSVQKRYYVIRRLEMAVDRLLTQYELLCGAFSERGGERRGYGQQKCGQRGCSLEQELSLVTTSWKDLLSYKYVMSDAHTHTLLLHLIVLYDALLKVYGKESGLSKVQRSHFSDEWLIELFKKSKGSFAAHVLEELLDVVDVLSATSRGLVVTKPHTTSHISFPDLTENKLFLMAQLLSIDSIATVNTGAVAANAVSAGAEPDEQVLQSFVEPSEQGEFLVNTTIRFYITQRLAHSFALLTVLAEKNAIASVCDLLPPLDTVQSPVVRECLQKMRADSSLKPLLLLWDSISSYRYIGDTNLIREVLLIVVQIYQVLIKVLAPKQEQEAVQGEEVFYLYSTISSLPLPELLMLLDEFTHQASSVVDVYQEGVTQGWRMVFKRYWWVPPAVIAGGISLYLRVKRLVWHPQYRKDSLVTALKAPKLR